MKIPETLLAQFLKHFPNHPHTFFPSSSLEYVLNVSLEEWQSAEYPYQWVKVEEAHGYQAWIEVEYGNMALTFGDKIIGVSSDFGIIVPAEHPRIVFLDKDDFGTTNYLYFSNNSQEKSYENSTQS